MRQSFMVAVLCAAVLPGAARSAAGDTEQAVLADCGQSGMAASAVDSCLERARILDETSPSPQIESLIARLETDATGHPATASDSPGVSPPSADNEATAQSKATSSPRRLGAGAAETPPSSSVRTYGAPSSDEDMNDDDLLPAGASPGTSSSDKGDSPGDDDGDDGDEPPIDDAPPG